MTVCNGLPQLTVPLPSRNDRCRFTLRPVTHTVQDFVDQLTHEDHGIDRVVLRTVGKYMCVWVCYVCVFLYLLLFFPIRFSYFIVFFFLSFFFIFIFYCLLFLSARFRFFFFFFFFFFYFFSLVFLSVVVFVFVCL